MPGKLQIDPAHPVGSLTAGEQQFTIAADTQHGKESIHTTINRDIPEMARNGVKNIMIEYPADTMQELEKKYPALAGAKTWEERRKVLDDQYDKLSDKRIAEGRKEAEGIDPDKDEQKFKEAYRRGSDRGEKMIAAEKLALEDAETDLRTNEILEKVYSKPPGMTDAEIREAAKEFVSSKSETPAKAAENFADLLIKSRDAGIRVHFSGDRGDLNTRVERNETREGIDQLNAENQKHVEHFTRSMADKNYVIPQEDRQAFQEYVNKATDLYKRNNAAEQKAIAMRDDPAREQARVDKLIELAKGEKSVAVWGSAHAHKKNDFNEMLDARLNVKAAQEGKPAPAETKVIELYDSKAEREKAQKRGDPTYSDEPDVRYYAKEGEVEITPSGKDSLEVKSSKVSASGPSVEEQYAQLMGNNVVGSVKSQPAVSESPVADRRATASPTITV